MRLRVRAPVPAALLLLSVLPPLPAPAQEIPRDEYLQFLPLQVPRLVRQTAASQRLQLFGDVTGPSYRDADGDGIDDARHDVLRRLAVRFAPFLVMNTTAIPMNFRLFDEGSGGLPLYVDTWNTAVPGRARIAEEAIDWLRSASDPCTEQERAIGSSRKDDCRLLELLDEFDPERPASARRRVAAVDPNERIFRVLFVDLPGSDPKSWRREYEHVFSQRLPRRYEGFLKAYVHPFIKETGLMNGEPAYEFVLQYWFFYPWNDGGNNHEGDWEHINVVVSPLDAVTRPLHADEVRRILEGRGLDAAEPGEQLVIKRVDYYFHNKVMVLDYSSPNAYLPRDEWERDVRSRIKERADEDWFWRMIRRRAYQDEDETRVNTHPIGHIGADNKGFDQLFAMPGGKNRDAHGTFPFPGLYKLVGPVGAAENIGTFFDHRKFFAAEPEERSRRLRKWRRGGVVHLADPALLEIVPDWERVIDRVRSDPEARERWSWLLLPLRWGYPAVRSPFAGIVANAETGNLAPLGPAFNAGWNRTGATDGFQRYAPHRLPRLVPLGLVDNYQNEWGFLNITLPTLAILPPFDVAWRIVAAPVRAALGRQDPTFYPQDRIPFRFVGLSSGVSDLLIPEEFGELLVNRRQFPEIVARLDDFVAERGSEATAVISSVDFADNPLSAFFQLSFFIGERFSSESSLRHSRSALGTVVELSDVGEPFRVGAELNLWEYTGSLRYNPLTGNVQPFAKAGYGLSWYRLENAAVNGALLAVPNSNWVRRPSLLPPRNLLPNTWHVGGGLELIAIRSVSAPPRGIDFSVRVEWMLYAHALGLDIADLPLESLVALETSPEDLPRDRGITRNELRAGLMVSF